MAKSVDSKLTLTYLEDTESRDSLVKQLSVELNVAVMREEFVIPGAASETDYIPPGIATIDYLMVYSSEAVQIRTEAAGSLYTIPAGGMFLIMAESADVDAVLITGHASNDADIIMWVGEAT
jgi:hypothetical protein